MFCAMALAVAVADAMAVLVAEHGRGGRVSVVMASSCGIVTLPLSCSLSCAANTIPLPQLVSAGKTCCAPAKLLVFFRKANA